MQAAISFDHLIGEGQAASGHLSAPIVVKQGMVLWTEDIPCRPRGR